MRKILLSDLRDISAKRPDGYYDEVVGRGHVETAEILILDDAVYAELQKKFSTAPIPILPIPRDQWPMWAKALANRSRPEDKGVGDVAARFIGDERSEKFKAWYLVTFGKPCGCNGRQRQWNLKYPL